MRRDVLSLQNAAPRGSPLKAGDGPPSPPLTPAWGTKDLFVHKPPAGRFPAQGFSDRVLEVEPWAGNQETGVPIQALTQASCGLTPPMQSPGLRGTPTSLSSKWHPRVHLPHGLGLSRCSWTTCILRHITHHLHMPTATSSESCSLQGWLCVCVCDFVFKSSSQPPSHGFASQDTAFWKYLEDAIDSGHIFQ